MRREWTYSVDMLISVLVELSTRDLTALLSLR